MTEKFNDDDEEATDKAMDDDEDDKTEVIGQPHPRHREPPARSPLLSASIQIFTRKYSFTSLRNRAQYTEKV